MDEQSDSILAIPKRTSSDYPFSVSPKASSPPQMRLAAVQREDSGALNRSSVAQNRSSIAQNDTSKPVKGVSPAPWMKMHVNAVKESPTCFHRDSDLRGSQVSSSVGGGETPSLSYMLSKHREAVQKHNFD